MYPRIISFIKSKREKERHDKNKSSINPRKNMTIFIANSICVSVTLSHYSMLWFSNMNQMELIRIMRFTYE